MNEENRIKHHEKGKSLAEKLTVTELISQLMHTSKGIARLGIKPYVWWNEALHGVARAGTATVFPQAICMAASFSEESYWLTPTVALVSSAHCPTRSKPWSIIAAAPSSKMYIAYQERPCMNVRCKGMQRR